MEIRIDVNKIVEKINVNEIVEEHIMSEIAESSKLEEIINDVLENEDIKDVINKKVINTIETYISSDEGKEYIVGKFNEAIDDSDIWTDDKIIYIVAEFLKKSLDIRLR